VSRRDVLLATAAPLLWGTAFVAAKPALEQFPPALMTALVYALTAALL
jgi:drug/metabolite transporter (DMT)-like permease